MKPSPDDIQEMYLGSLEAIGIDPTVHDIRFVEDNWESPTLGAWGLGWEVWLNGMEVTQFTYFQQVGGLECRPVTGEITYGLERLAMYLQNVQSIFDLVWTDGPLGRITYGDVYHQNEVEQSKYNFEEADVDALFKTFDHAEHECERLIELGLALPAYEQMLTASHTFNLLDARQAISVTERQRFILRVRTMSRAICEAYYASREALGFPDGRVGRQRENRHEQADDFLVEIGTEELPPKALRSLMDAFGESLAAASMMRGSRMARYTLREPAAPAVMVKTLAHAQDDRRVEQKGPPTKVAFDADGNPPRRPRPSPKSAA